MAKRHARSVSNTENTKLRDRRHSPRVIEDDAAGWLQHLDNSNTVAPPDGAEQLAIYLPR